MSETNGNDHETPAAPQYGAPVIGKVRGVLILVGPFIWFTKTNGAINAYWRSLGAQ